jgi:RNA polymerase sigma factor (sigma-70 family)
VSRSDAEFTAIVERHRPRILTYCQRRTSNAAVDDVVSEVFAVAWRRRKDMPTGDQALPWLFGVARNIIGHHWRGVSRRSRLAAKTSGQAATLPRSPEDVVVEQEDHVMVRAALDRLKESDREILMLSAWEGLSHVEMAAALNISLSAVDKRLVRAKQRLAREFKSVTRSHGHRPSAGTQKGGAGT